MILDLLPGQTTQTRSLSVFSDRSKSSGRCVIGSHRPCTKEFGISESTFFVSKAALRNLKHGAQSCARSVRSSHLSEALASALGFRTHAALCAALHGRTTVEVPKPSNARMVRRLHELGYANIEQGQRIVPEFDQSYFAFRNSPLRKVRSARWWAWRNLMVMGINAGLEQRLFGLAPSENW